MTKKKTKGTLIVISGPSGAGKSTVIAELLSEREDIHFSVSYTTRAPRRGEQDGVDYNFVSQGEFEGMIERQELLEYAQYVGNYYGTSLKVIQDKLDQGVDVMLEIEVQGAATVKQKCPDAVLIFVMPPTFEELSRRLHGRATDDESVITGRLERAKAEYQQIPLYDYLVINDSVPNATQEILSILAAEGCRVKQRLPMIQTQIEGVTAL